MAARVDVSLIRELRYGDGLSTPVVAQAVGCCLRTVTEHAPGYIGKVPNEPLRQAFLASRVTAVEVARDLGWRAGPRADSSRVKRTLGLLDEISRHGGKRYRRRLIDWETASLIADAIDVPRWEVVPDVDRTIVQ
jgi:hypothetical protein